MKAFAAMLALAALGACSHGAPGPRSNAAACGDGATVIEGACVPYRTAEAFCGVAATPRAGGGCAQKTCAPGEALDLDHGLCLPEPSVFRTLLHGRPRDEDDTRRPTCRHGRLVSIAGRVSCADGPLACGRGERWREGVDGGAGRCEALPACGAGRLFDESTSKCTAVVRGRDVDVGTWARLAIGTDGGEGTNAFCAPVRAAMAAPGAALTGSRARFQVRVAVPDNDVTQTSVRLVPRPGTSTAAADAAERSLEQLVQILHFYAGTSLAASASLDVSCNVSTGPEPTLEAPP
jgi:hypothetical protein